MRRRKRWLRRLRLAVNQKKVLVEIAVELGVISLAAVALPVFFDRGSFLVLISGILFSVAIWALAILMAGKYYD